MSIKKKLDNMHINGVENIPYSTMEKIFGEDYREKLILIEPGYFSVFYLPFEEEEELYILDLSDNPKRGWFEFHTVFFTGFYKKIDKKMFEFLQEKQKIKIENIENLKKDLEPIERVLNHKSFRLRKLF